MNGNGETFLSTRQAGQILGFTTYYIRLYCQQGVIRGVKVGKSSHAHWRIPMSEIHRLTGRKDADQQE